LYSGRLLCFRGEIGIGKEQGSDFAVNFMSARVTDDKVHTRSI